MKLNIFNPFIHYIYFAHHASKNVSSFNIRKKTHLSPSTVFMINIDP